MKRVVLGMSPSGLSTVDAVTPPPAIFFMASMVAAHDRSQQPRQRVAESRDQLDPGQVQVAEIFGSLTPIPTIEGDTASTPGELNLDSPAGGFKVRIASYGPGVETSMHATSTFDIDVVLSGEMTVMTEDGGEVLLKASDSIVVPGAAHNWRSGPEGCRLAFVMMGAGG